MNRNTQILLIGGVAVLALSFFGLLFYYFNTKKTAQVPKQSQENVAQVEEFEVEGPKKGELNYQEPQTKIEIGTEGVTKGSFEKVEAGEIYVKTEANVSTKIQLTTDEVVLSCTKQDLTNAQELDFNQVSKVNVTTASQLGSKISVNEPIVLFSQNVAGVNRVHTVAMAEAKCTF